MLDPLTEVAPETPEAIEAIARWGNLFWLRHMSGQGHLCIPVVDGIPRVADFIIAPPGALRPVGWSKLQADAAQAAPKKDEPHV
jgi:hypothetical protein